MNYSLFAVLLACLPALTPANLDSLPINKIQVIGSHNSYKQPIDPALVQVLKRADSSMVKSIDYSHPSLSEQLSMGLQNLEIDVYADAAGGKYAHPKGLDWTGKNAQTTPYDPQGVMNEPGFKVFHIQEIDFRSNCLTFKNCLQELKSWSDAHKGHYPVFITMNAKDDVINRPGFAVPEKFTAEVYNQLDQVIVETLGRQKLITPDDVQGSAETLEKAVLAGKWPTVAAARGKFMFVLDEIGAKRTAYIDGHSSLKGRILFTNSEPGTPEAAFIIRNNPITELAAIQELVKKGYLVRTRADADTKQARQNDRRMFEAACQSGAQIITTDYYVKSKHFDSPYVISFEGGSYIKQNPLL
ncbi:phosphatidylinositol-specific phospholipase C1-like protein [Spirosoma agri]|uniref:Calcium-dependent phosphoinositide phospholipase C n=1 Tax=Spirosoma agri TaxID=1987381 RepID=A0A6M0ID84_9BACT|nr:phosphatidylinositol-specific phospholipase C1-like protein [Spirosoma agri]NEU66219.1 hypothetical protein [Spirosoma agri]